MGFWVCGICGGSGQQCNLLIVNYPALAVLQLTNHVIPQPTECDAVPNCALNLLDSVCGSDRPGGAGGPFSKASECCNDATCISSAFVVTDCRFCRQLSPVEIGANLSSHNRVRVVQLEAILCAFSLPCSMELLMYYNRTQVSESSLMIVPPAGLIRI